MKFDIEERIKEEARYIIRTGCTVREAADNFKVSKSTIHKDMSERLHMINFSLYLGVLSVLSKNLNERAARGGEATRKKYLNN